MTDDHTAVKARISGKVQGVSYRAWTRSEAKRLGLAGWVRNERDGSVTALIAGPEAAVAEMIALLWTGPPAASVSDVASETVDPGARFTRFDITR